MQNINARNHKLTYMGSAAYTAAYTQETTQYTRIHKFKNNTTLHKLFLKLAHNNSGHQGVDQLLNNIQTV